LKIPIDIIEGLSAAKALEVAQTLGFADRSKEISEMFLKVYQLFLKTDSLMVELNPLAEDSNGECNSRNYIVMKE
jgi:succinyl-CoA synthetase beta subunit